MEYQMKIRVNQYLHRFDEILCQMAEKMLNSKITNNITVDFITCMIPHHQAAIYMCENLLNYTNYLPLKEIAKDIISMQTKGIEQMEKIEMTTPKVFNSKTDVNCYIESYLSITRNMICRMKNSPRTNNINLNFTNEMIPHHEGAIAMCNNLLQYRIDNRLREVAKNIIEEQSKGVKQLMEIREELCQR